MNSTNKKTRLEYLKDQFKIDFNKALKRGRITKTLDIHSNLEVVYDKNFLEYQKLIGDTKTGTIDEIFDFFIELDPTLNKEYVSWYMFLYRNILKMPIDEPEDLLSYKLEHKLFFEDIASKVYGGVLVFDVLKKTIAFSRENRDINTYKTIRDFVTFIQPYSPSELSDGDDSNVHTLNTRELAAINNFLNMSNGGEDNGSGIAELLYEDKEWIVVTTHDKKANNEFGKHTTWCTAGTRFGNMFDSYYLQGNLFVLIKKGYGSKSEIKKNPLVRLQFHFQSDQFMNALDQRIKINEFFFDNKNIREYFKSYIIKNVLPQRQKKYKQSEDIKYLLNLGYGDEIIKILKESKPETVDFSGHKIETEYLIGIGEIATIVKLDLSECGITEIPDSIRNLKKLEYLKIRGNKGIKKIPSWFSELYNLKYFDCAGCDIQNEIVIGDNLNIVELVLDFNENLKKLPKNIGVLKKMQRLTAASCNLEEIPDDIANCEDLYLIDVHDNTNLTKIPIGLSKLPEIVAICIDNTQISNQTKKLMEENSNGVVCIIKYD